MTDTDEPTLPVPRFTRLRPLLWCLAVAAILIAVAIALEVTRWSPLPPQPLPATESGPAAATNEGDAARRLVDAWLREHVVTGLAACVAKAGKIRWCSAFGYADVERRRELEAATPMRVGSVTKTVTAILLARLAERGIVDLDRPIGEISSRVPPHLAAVTLRHLATHTAGVRHYRWRFDWPPHETWSRRRYASVGDSLSIFAANELLFEPGSGFQYSTHGYTLLGAVLEDATGESFDALLEREIVAPAGLAATRLERSDAPDEEAARPYEVIGRRYREALRVDISRAWPGGGLHSSARDLARLASGLPTGQLLAPETLERSLVPQTLADGSDNPQSYALGWRVGQTSGSDRSCRVAHHGGVASGGSAFLVLFPDQALAVSVITNTRTGSGPLIGLAGNLAEPFLEASANLSTSSPISGRESPAQ